MSETIRDREYREVPVTTAPKRRTNWSWLLMLPLFFIFGWFANDAINGQPADQNNATGTPIYGVGGGPGATATPASNMDVDSSMDRDTSPDNDGTQSVGPVSGDDETDDSNNSTNSNTTDPEETVRPIRTPSPSPMSSPDEDVE